MCILFFTEYVVKSVFYAKPYTNPHVEEKIKHSKYEKSLSEIYRPVSGKKK